jgi:outer membrane protein assembly factor BamD
MFRSLLAILSLAILAACSSSESAKGPRTVDDVWAEAKKAYDNGEWLDAQSKLDVIKLQYPASQYADDAQFYLAEITFERGEYIMAAFNYSMVRKAYPQSEFVRQAMYKTGVCYDKISLPADRDQENTRKAIQAYSDFQSMFLGDSLALEATRRIRDLRDRLAERNWLIAEHYLNTQVRRAALIHLDAIIDEFPDSKWLEPAILTKLEILYVQERNDDARALIATYRRLVKDPQRSADVDAIERRLP